MALPKADNALQRPGCQAHRTCTFRSVGETGRGCLVSRWCLLHWGVQECHYNGCAAQWHTVAREKLKC